MQDSSTTDVIRLRRSRIYDLVFLMTVGAVVLLVVMPAMVPLVTAFKAPCPTVPVKVAK